MTKPHEYRIADFGRYHKAIFVREQTAQTGERGQQPRFGDRVCVYGNTYEFQPRRINGEWKTFTPKVDADSPIREGRMLVTASGKKPEAAKADTGDGLDF